MTREYLVFDSAGQPSPNFRGKRQVKSAEYRKSLVRPKMVPDVIYPTIVCWVIFFFFFTGVGFFSVSYLLPVPNNETMAVLGFGLFASSGCTIIAGYKFWTKFEEKAWHENYAEYEDPEDRPPGENIIRQVSSNTRRRTRFEWTETQLRNLAIKCFRPDGTWRETDNIARRQFEGIGIPDVNMVYPDIKQDFIDLDWVEDTHPHNWTDIGMDDLWQYYPPTRRSDLSVG